MTSPETDLVLAYLERVVNQRDLSAVDELVDPSYVGSGSAWPADRESLRAFYRWQAVSRPDWHIDVQQTVAVGESVVVRALAGGTVSATETGRPLAAPESRAVEWLAAYRVSGGLITAIDVLAIRDR